MFVAILVNTFHGLMKPYGLFKSEDEAQNWIDTTGHKYATGGASFSITEVTIVFRTGV